MITMSPELERIVEAICTAVNPQRIVLFGSQARGAQHIHSDYDLCVITKDNSMRPLDIIYKARIAITDIAETPLDIVALDAGTYAQRAAQSGTLEYEIARDGVVLYAA